ncbi:hypothetical protein F909_03618 [Acinetobacter sp. ANC 3929]|uniref:hypothetical protein n=1 Tax=Acinetobacter sp. ANC 3929 TaxID=1217707 RepID=UPI0002CE7167|nr:hypothetical protein [Acinetobacter sp. ANC 3929]ENW78656.1 hypothetical protein F909_03618 [Acinetobacter sp. ANC 3929]
MSILDLPLERQKVIAEQDGFGNDVDSWREHIKTKLAAGRDRVNLLEAVSFNDLSKSEQSDYRRWGNKVNSGNAAK